MYENATKIEATNDTDIEIDNDIENINKTSTNTYTSVDNSTDSQDLLNLIAVSVTHFMAIFIWCLKFWIKIQFKQELEREAALKNIQSFEDYKRTTFGSVQLGVEKYECYARLLGKIAKKYDEQETLDAIAEELRQLFWRWRDCQDEKFVYLSLQTIW